MLTCPCYGAVTLADLLTVLCDAIGQLMPFTLYEEQEQQLAATGRSQLSMMRRTASAIGKRVVLD